MKRATASHSYRLGTFVSLLLVTTIVVTIALVGSIILIYRIPQINLDSVEAVQQKAGVQAQLLKFVLNALESQLRPVAVVAENAPADVLAKSLQALVGQGEQFLAIYVAGPDGIVRSDSISGARTTDNSLAAGADLSRNLLFRAAHDGQVLWSDKYLSVVSGEVVVGVALRLGSWTVIGEIAPEYLRKSVFSVAGGDDRVLVVDSTGECIVDSDNTYSSADNLGSLPMVQAAMAGQATGQQLADQTGSVFFGSARPEQLGWAFIVTRPAGIRNEEIRRVVILIVVSFFGSLLTGLLLVPTWTRRLSKPIQGMVDRTHSFAEGNYTQSETDSPKSRIVELNAFSDDFQRMAVVIHERETRMARSEERLRATLESTPSVAVQWYDSFGCVLYWNTASELLFGFTAQEATGSIITETPLMFVDFGQANEFLELLKAIDSSGKPHGPAEFSVRRKDGVNLVVLSSSFAIPSDDGKKIFVCMDVDVTERKRAESDLQDSERRLEAIFNASPAAMSVSDFRNGSTIINVNPAWERQFRRQRNDVIGLNGLDIGLWADPADRRKFFDLIDNSGAIEEMEADLLAGNGQRLICSISAKLTTIRDVRLLLMMTTDITERRRIENEIKQLNAELEARVDKRTEELSEAIEELATTLDNLRRTQKELVQTEKLASLGALVAGVAHELNTPIGNAVTVSSTLLYTQKTFSEAMKTGLTRSALHDFVESVGEIALILDRNLHRAADLVGSFKQLAVDQSSYQRRPFDLQDIVNEILLAMGPSVRKTTHTVHNQIAQGIRLDSYPGPLGQVLMNLINNALIHAFNDQERGNIDVLTTLIEPAWVTLEVRDDGRGISEENQKRIFDPFFTTRLGQGGSGLGLNIAFTLVVDLLGGKLDVTSVQGKGSCFRLSIPTVAPQPKPPTDESTNTTTS